MNLEKIKTFILDIFFPKICLNCQREGDYLCQDCLATLEILDFHQRYSTRNLTDLYFALPYQNINTKRLIQKFKYQPFIKELAKTLASLIITHFQLLDNGENFSPPPLSKNSGNVSTSNHNLTFPKSGGGWILIPIPLGKKRLRWRGFNQAEEIGKKLSLFLKIPLVGDALMKIKETQPQVELLEKERKENLKEAFLVNPVRKQWRIWDPIRNCWFSNGVKDKEVIRNKKILLVDDVYTTGSTMEECARILKEAGAKEVIGIVVARAKPEEDYFQNAN